MKKSLESVIVDGHVVEIEARRGDGGILFVATCGELRREGFMTMHPNSARTKEQHAIDVQKFAYKLAAEAAGHLQNEKLLDDFFEEENGQE